MASQWTCLERVAPGGGGGANWGPVPGQVLPDGELLGVQQGSGSRPDTGCQWQRPPAAAHWSQPAEVLQLLAPACSDRAGPVAPVEGAEGRLAADQRAYEWPPGGWSCGPQGDLPKSKCTGRAPEWF